MPGDRVIVVIVSADAEWRCVRDIFSAASVESSPLGECFETVHPECTLAAPVVFFHGGWGKIAASASAQYVIDRWHPDLLINLGTCGGFAGLIEQGEVVLAERTIVYDILEQMGDPDEALAHFATTIDFAWLGDDDPHPVRRETLVSADRDLVAAEIAGLAARFGAVAGDWESGAIAWVAARNAVPCLILRGVSDLVSEDGGEAYDGAQQVWTDATETVMQSLVAQLPAWLDLAAARLAPE